MKRAVQAGYWPLYRYNPANKDHPFTLDSPAPSLEYREFLSGEVRYSSLYRTFPKNAEDLFRKAEKDAQERYSYYKKLSEE